ncbi:MAG: metal dependent phosphohydrolase [Lachnospiraceae bacterium]|nr:metal dependent phosphohydrolase [Lachnospiraceae bacterium]
MNFNSRMSLRRTTYFIVLLLFALLGLITIFLGMFLYINTMDENNRRLAKHIAKTTVENLDADQLEDYLMTLEKDASYYQVLNGLIKIKDNNAVNYINVFKVTEDGLYIIYDTNHNEPKSNTLEHDLILNIVSPDIVHGWEEFPTLVTQGEKGWLCSAYEPIRNRKGEIVAISSVGIILDTTVDNRPAFLILMLLSMWASAIIFTFIIALCG